MKTYDLINAIAQDASVRTAPMARRLIMATSASCVLAAVALVATIGVRPDIWGALGTWRFDAKLLSVAALLAGPTAAALAAPVLERLEIIAPAATGSGWRARFVLGATVTSNSTVIKVANSTDAFVGFSQVVSDNAAAVLGYIASAGTDDTVTLNGTTTGGYIGDIIEVEDIAAGTFLVQIAGKATGTEATPFSATV